MDHHENVSHFPNKRNVVSEGFGAKLHFIRVQSFSGVRVFCLMALWGALTQIIALLILKIGSI